MELFSKAFKEEKIFSCVQLFANTKVKSKSKFSAAAPSLKLILKLFPDEVKHCQFTYVVLQTSALVIGFPTVMCSIGKLSLPLVSLLPITNLSGNSPLLLLIVPFCLHRRQMKILFSSPQNEKLTSRRNVSSRVP